MNDARVKIDARKPNAVTRASLLFSDQSHHKEFLLNKFQILLASIATGWSIALQVYAGLSRVHDWEHFQSFKVEHTIGVEEVE